jgi:CRISPR system Cascade subunit CasE
LVWTLFGDTADRDRDFLWREAEPGLFYTLSHRPPEDRHAIFDLDEPKSFAPSLKCGDRLTFSLRANATIAKGGGPDRRGKRCDVVMDAIYSTPAGERASRRAEAVEIAGLGWLERQANKAGFSLGSPPTSPRSARVTAYQTLRIDHRDGEVKFGVLDFEGVLEVTDPDRFVNAVAHGFGRAKGFGCGLMLIRRA